MVNSTSIKICLLGHFSVGKTSLARYMVDGDFQDDYLRTIGVKISRILQTKNIEQPPVFLWDLAGGEKPIFSKGYLRATAGAIIVCDITRIDTLMALDTYAHVVRKINPAMQLTFIANKSDLTADQMITDVDLAGIAAQFDVPYFLTSAKTGHNVQLAFETLVEKVTNSSDD